MPRTPRLLDLLQNLGLDFLRIRYVEHLLLELTDALLLLSAYRPGLLDFVGEGLIRLAQLLNLLLQPPHPLAESGPCRLLLGQLLLGLHHLTLQVSYLISQAADTAPEEGDCRHVAHRRCWRASLLRRLREQGSGRRLQLRKHTLNG